MRRNISDNFEEMYLKFNTTKRDLAKAKLHLLDKPDFKRTTKYMANMAFYRNFNVFNRAGFTQEDVEQITVIFGLVFSGNSPMMAHGRKYYNYMMRFIQQRNHDLVKWCKRKIEFEQEFLDDSIDSIQESDIMDIKASKPLISETDFIDTKVDLSILVRKRSGRKKILNLILNNKLDEETADYANELLLEYNNGR